MVSSTDTTSSVVYDDESVEQICIAMQNPPLARSYDDLLLIKSHICRAGFFSEHLLPFLNPRQIHDVCRSLNLEKYDTDSTLYSQGDSATKVYVIVRGRVRLSIQYRLDLTMGDFEMREKHVADYITGQSFGEKAFLSGEDTRVTSAIATEPTIVMTMQKSFFTSILSEKTEETITRRNAGGETYVSKEGVIRVLSKIRDRRTTQELDSVAAYLHRRIPFFQKFSMDQLIELCRVAETVIVNGRSILFKQGQIGQAFYVILSGNVEVWVASQTPAASTSGPGSSTGDIARRMGYTGDITEGLGVKVNQLVLGDVFGERALENETSQRMASIITGEETTELIVISKEDYHNLVYVMMHGESMHKLQLLRRTELFHSLDVVHLRALARFMEPRKWQINEEVAVIGKRVQEVIIIESGECRVLADIVETYEAKSYNHPRLTASPTVDTSRRSRNNSPTVATVTPRNGRSTPSSTRSQKHSAKNSVLSPDVSKNIINNNTSTGSNVNSARRTKSTPRKRYFFGSGSQFEEAKIAAANVNAACVSDGNATGTSPPTSPTRVISKLHHVDLGRIAPNSVLGTSLALCESVHQEVFHKETIVAASLVSGYTVNKNDFFNHMPKDSFSALVKCISEYKSPVLSPLWENQPRVLSDSQWRMEKAWSRFREQLIKNPKAPTTILQSLKYVSRLPMTTNLPGGKGQSSEVPSPHGNTHGRETPTRLSGDVTIDWGLPAGSRENLADFFATGSTVNTTTNTTANATTNLSNKLSSKSSTNLSNPVQSSAVGINETGNDTTITSANLLRERMTASYSADRLLHNTSMSRTTSCLPRNATNQSMNIPSSSSILASTLNNTGGCSNIPGAQELAEKFSSVVESSHLIDLPFCLIQVHRESSWSKSSSEESLSKQMNRRSMRCYARICGQFHTSAKAKEMADLQMEQFFLSACQADRQLEHQLLLNWDNFNSFDSLDANYTDHFFVYCRSTPLEFASITPPKSLFHASFPAVCKPLNQRYAAAVVNVLSAAQLSAVHRVNEKSDTHSGETSARNGENDGELSARGDRLHLDCGSDDDSICTSSLVGSVNEKYNPRGGFNLAPLSSVTGRVNPRSQWPPYLFELAAVHEVVLVTTTRMESIKHAVRRYCSMRDTVKPLSPQKLSTTSTVGRNLFFRSLSNAAMNTITHGPSLSGSGGCVDSSSRQLELRPFDATSPDRITKELNMDGRRLCILPLFKWVLVSDETLNTLDLRHVFEEDHVRRVLLAEEVDSFNSNQLDRRHTSMSDLDDNTEEVNTNIVSFATAGKKEVDTALVKSFSEVGLLSSRHQRELTRAQPTDGGNKWSSDHQDQLAVLSIVHDELVTHNLHQEAVTYIRDNPHEDTLGLAEVIAPPTSVFLNGTPMYSTGTSYSNTDNTDNLSGAVNIVSEDTSSSPARRSKFGIQYQHLQFSDLQKQSIRSIEDRLSGLNSTAASRNHLIESSRKLCDSEHASAERTSRIVTHSQSLESLLGNPATHASTSNQLLNRLDVMQSLLQQRVTSGKGKSAGYQRPNL